MPQWVVSWDAKNKVFNVDEEPTFNALKKIHEEETGKPYEFVQIGGTFARHSDAWEFGRRHQKMNGGTLIGVRRMFVENLPEDIVNAVEHEMERRGEA